LFTASEVQPRLVSVTECHGMGRHDEVDLDFEAHRKLPCSRSQFCLPVVSAFYRPYTIRLIRHEDMKSYHYHIPTERHVSVFVSFQLVPINQLASPHHDVELCRHRKKKIPNLLYNRPTFLQFATNCLLFTFADFFFYDVRIFH